MKRKKRKELLVTRISKAGLSAAQMAPLLSRYDGAEKKCLTIAVGCAGGRRRSVFAAEKLYRGIGRQGFNALDPRHRDLEKWEARQSCRPQGGKKSNQRKDKAA